MASAATPLDKYQALQVVGKGSYGKAVLAKRKSDSKKCIIKQISFKSLSRKEQQKAHQEGLVLSKLQHPNIVGYWENFVVRTRTDTMLCIVMEYADGGDMENYLKKRYGRVLQESQVLDWFVQICLAVKHIHDRKILHRDLKTQNIFLTSSGIVKVGDFGIARVLSGTMEQAATAIGTPYYMSPEIMQEKRYNSKSDMWSLGCILYEMCALRHPFEANTMKGLIMRVVRGVYPPLPSSFSRPLNDFVKIMLTVEPRQRASINQVLRSPVMASRISSFLSEAQVAAEFSHTILHGEHLLRGEPQLVPAHHPMPTILEKPKPKPQPQVQPRGHRDVVPPKPARVAVPSAAAVAVPARKPPVPARQVYPAAPIRKPPVPVQKRDRPPQQQRQQKQQQQQRAAFVPVRERPQIPPRVIPRARNPVSKAVVALKPPVPVARRAPAREHASKHQPLSIISPKPPSYPVQRQERPASGDSHDQNPVSKPAIARVAPFSEAQQPRSCIAESSDSKEAAIAPPKAAAAAPSRVGQLRPSPLDGIRPDRQRQDQHTASAADSPASSPAWLQKLNGQISEVKKQVSQIQRKLSSPTDSSPSTTDGEPERVHYPSAKPSAYSKLAAADDSDEASGVFLTAPPEPKVGYRVANQHSAQPEKRAPMRPSIECGKPDSVSPRPHIGNDSNHNKPRASAAPAGSAPGLRVERPAKRQHFDNRKPAGAAKNAAPAPPRPSPVDRWVSKKQLSPAYSSQSPNTPSSSEDSKQRAARIRAQREAERTELRKQIARQRRELALQQRQNPQEDELPIFLAAPPRVLLRVDSEEVSQITSSDGALSTVESQLLRESPSVLSAFGSEQADDLRLADIEEVDEEQAQESVEVPNSLRLSQSVNRAAESTASIQTVVSEASSDDSDDSDHDELSSRPAEVDEAEPEAEPEMEEAEDRQSLQRGPSASIDDQDKERDEERDGEEEEYCVEGDQIEAGEDAKEGEVAEPSVEHDEDEVDADADGDVHEVDENVNEIADGRGDELADMIDDQAVAELVMQDVDKIYGDSASDEEGDEVATYILPDQSYQHSAVVTVSEEQMEAQDRAQENEYQLMFEQMHEVLQLTICDGSDDEFGSESSDHDGDEEGSSHQEESGGAPLPDEVFCDLDAWEQTALVADAGGTELEAPAAQQSIDDDNGNEEPLLHDEQNPEPSGDADFVAGLDQPSAADVQLLQTQLEELLGFQTFPQAYRFLKGIGDREDDDDDAIMNELESVVGLQNLVHLDKLFQLIDLEEQLHQLHGAGRRQL